MNSQHAMMLSVKQFILSFPVLLCLVFPAGITSANSTESYDKLWSVAVVTGSLGNDTSYKYYLEPQVRLIDTPYVFNQLLLLAGLGIQLNNKFALFAGPGWITTKSPQGIESQENRLWQQLNWLMVGEPGLNIISRTRLEERSNTNSSQIAVRFRERIWARIPFRHQDTYSFSCFNEVFLNLNQPQWSSPYFFEQNRAFIGLSAQVSKSTLIDAGYLNQYINAASTHLDNVFLLSFTVNW